MEAYSLCLYTMLTSFPTALLCIFLRRHSGLYRPHHGQDNGGPDGAAAANLMLQAAQACMGLIQQQELNEIERKTLSLVCSAIEANLPEK